MNKRLGAAAAAPCTSVVLLEGGQGGQSPPPPEFGRSVHPIQTRVADYAPNTTASPPDSKSYLHLWLIQVLHAAVRKFMLV